MQTINFRFGSTALSFCFKFSRILGLFSLFEPFGYFFCPLGLFLGSRSGSKTFLEPTNVEYQFLFWKYSHIFWFLIRPNFGPFFYFLSPSGFLFGPIGAILGVEVRLKNIFGTYKCLINFCFGSTALSFCFSFDQILGLFCTFWALRGYFWGWGQV